jgi:hypothetical protein
MTRHILRHADTSWETHVRERPDGRYMFEHEKKGISKRSKNIVLINEYFHSRPDAISFGRFWAKVNKYKLIKIKCLEPQDFWNASRLYKLTFKRK